MNLLEDCGAPDEGIPLPNVSHGTLGVVVAYCLKRQNTPPSDETTTTMTTTDKKEVAPWELEFCSELSQQGLFDVLLAANYLEIPSLLNATCKTIADLIKGKSPEEIRTIFNIKNDFTPEEEAQVRKENEWCEER